MYCFLGSLQVAVLLGTTLAIFAHILSLSWYLSASLSRHRLTLQLWEQAALNANKPNDFDQVDGWDWKPSRIAVDHVIRFATLNDTTAIVDLSKRMQASLIATGSLQEVGPLDQNGVNHIVENKRSFVVETLGEPRGRYVVGCAFF